MAQAKKGDTVKVHYTGKLNDGTAFDSSREREPIQFVIGEKKLIPGFENAVIELSPGEKKTITIASDDAYGPHREELVISIEKNKIPTNVNPQIGQVLQFQKQSETGDSKGETIALTVMGITDTHYTLDANHPLAGKDLIFEIELIEIL